VGFRRLLILLLCVPVGCAHLASREEKEISFKPFAQRRVGNQTLADYIEQRTAVLVAGARPLGIKVQGDQVGVELKPTAADGKVDVGSATAVGADGYFLTAAHCIRREPVFLVVPLALGPQAFTCRVVWRPPQAAADVCDLAVLNISASLPGAFAMAANSEVGTGDPVVTSGTNGEAGGKLLSATPVGPSPALGLPFMFSLVHNIPLTHGDSGGPLTTLDGKLIGIEILVTGVYIGPRQGVALRPDSQWLKGIIDRDRHDQK
jgi:S1-C subfamily serine protease